MATRLHAILVSIEWLMGAKEVEWEWDTKEVLDEEYISWEILCSMKDYLDSEYLELRWGDPLLEGLRTNIEKVKECLHSDKTIVVMGDKYPEEFRSLFREFVDKPLENAKEYLKILQSQTPLYMLELTETFLESLWRGDWFSSYQLQTIFELLSGIYTSESQFFCLDFGEIKLVKEEREEIESNPEDWVIGLIAVRS